MALLSGLSFTQLFSTSLPARQRCVPLPALLPTSWDGMGWDGMGWDGMGWDGMGWDAVYPPPPDPPPVGLRAAQTNPGTSGGAVKLHSVPTAARVSVNALMSSAVVSCFFLLLSEVAAGRGWCLQLSLYGMLLSASAFVPCGAGGAAQSRRNAAHSASRASGRALIRKGGLCGSALQGAEL